MGIFRMCLKHICATGLHFVRRWRVDWRRRCDDESRGWWSGASSASESQTGWRQSSESWRSPGPGHGRSAQAQVSITSASLFICTESLWFRFQISVLFLKVWANKCYLTNNIYATVVSFVQLLIFSSIAYAIVIYFLWNTVLLMPS